MNERIRELALEAGLYYHPHGTCCMDEMFPFHFNPAEADKAYGKFAALVAAAEREACAKVCEDLVAQYNLHSNFICARTIRARGVAE